MNSVLVLNELSPCLLIVDELLPVVVPLLQPSEWRIEPQSRPQPTGRVIEVERIVSRRTDIPAEDQIESRF